MFRRIFIAAISCGLLHVVGGVLMGAPATAGSSTIEAGYAQVAFVSGPVQIGWEDDVIRIYNSYQECKQALDSGVYGPDAACVPLDTGVTVLVGGQTPTA